MCSGVEGYPYSNCGQEKHCESSANVTYFLFGHFNNVLKISIESHSYFLAVVK